MDAVCISRAAGRATGDSAGALRSGADRRLESLASVPARDVAVVETVDTDCAATADDGSATRFRSDLYSDRGRPRLRHGNDQPLHLSHGVSLLRFRICGGDVVRATR